MILIERGAIMKLMDKIKNLFLDEEEYEDDEEEEFPQVQEKVKEHKDKKEKVELLKPSKEELPKVMLETIKKEEDIKKEKVELKFKPEDLIEEQKKNDEIKEQPKKFNFPIDLNDDFPSRSSKVVFDQEKMEEKPQPQSSGNVNVLKIDKQVTQKVTELYSHREEEKVKPKFKASPVISPVYGVLDKNYKKDEVKEKSEEMVGMKRPSKKVDFETVRKKAFGNLTDEIKDNMLCENCELYKEVKRISALKEDDLLYDMTVDEPKEKTIEKAYDDYEEFGVVYEPKAVKKVQDEELEENHEVEEIDKPIINYNKVDEDDDIIGLLDKKEEKEEIKEDKQDDEILDEIPSREKKKDTKVDADFFELIDSMYKERVDE